MTFLSRRNYKYFLLEGSLFWVALSFISQDGLVPVFIYSYTGSLTLVGMAVTIRSLFTILPKVLTAHRLGHIKNMPRFTAKVMFFTRPLYFFMIPILLYIEDPLVIVWLYLIITALFWGGHSFITVTWNDVFGRTVEPRLRGKVHGYQQLFGGIAGLVSGYVVKRLLDSPVLNREHSYMIIFGLCGLFMLSSASMLLPVRDSQRQIPEEKVSFTLYMKGLAKYFEGHRSFKQVTGLSFISKIILLANPFIILTARNILLVSDEYVSTLIYLQILGGLAGGFIWGNVSHRLGNRMVILASNASVMCCAAMVCISILLLGTNFSMILIGFCVFIGGINTTSWLGYLNYTLDIAGEEERIDLLILQSILMLPLSLGGYLIGVAFSKFGYFSVYFSVILLALIAVWASVGVKDQVDKEERDDDQ